MRDPVADVLGTSGRFFDPLWRIDVALTPLEQHLLRSRWVRRLAFVSHAGASSIATTQSYSRLEHSLGLMALVAHFDAADHAARAAALLHDIGHLAFSHTLEGIADLDHHVLGRDRIRELAPTMQRFGVDPEEVLAIELGTRPSVLQNSVGALKLDHLDSFVRSGCSHGRTTQAPPETLDRLHITRGAVDTDADTADYLATLVAGEARSHLSEINVVTTAILRELVGSLLAGAGFAAAQLPPLTDDQLWSALLASPDTATVAQQLRDDPWHWAAFPLQPEAAVPPAAVRHRIRRLYLDVPLVNGRRHPTTFEVLRSLPVVPISYLVAARS